MATIAILGGTGYAGSAIAAEAAGRGHTVIPVSRRGSTGGRQGSLHDQALVEELAAEADVLVVAIRASATPEGTRLEDAVDLLAAAAAEQGARLGFVGGAGSLHVGDTSGPRVVDLPSFPAEHKGEALAHADVLAALRQTPHEVDWFYLSPAGTFGAYAPGEATGRYRTGGDVLVTNEEGVSEISGPDYAKAFVDEIEHPAHHRRRFTVAH